MWSLQIMEISCFIDMDNSMPLCRHFSFLIGRELVHLSKTVQKGKIENRKLKLN